jgi:hypothetical protein
MYTHDFDLARTIIAPELKLVKLDEVLQAAFVVTSI